MQKTEWTLPRESFPSNLRINAKRFMRCWYVYTAGVGRWLLRPLVVTPFPMAAIGCYDDYILHVVRLVENNREILC